MPDWPQGLRFIGSAEARGEARPRWLAQALSGELRKLDGVSVFCDPKPRTGVVSFRLDAPSIALAGTILDESFGICVRTGLHCAPAAHQAIGTFPEGTVRASFGKFNSHSDVDALVEAVRQIRAVS